jgi:hypothetical protein
MSSGRATHRRGLNEEQLGFEIVRYRRVVEYHLQPFGAALPGDLVADLSLDRFLSTNRLGFWDYCPAYLVATWVWV